MDIPVVVIIREINPLFQCLVGTYVLTVGVVPPLRRVNARPEGRVRRNAIGVSSCPGIAGRSAPPTGAFAGGLRCRAAPAAFAAETFAETRFAPPPEAIPPIFAPEDPALALPPEEPPGEDCPPPEGWLLADSFTLSSFVLMPILRNV